MKWFLAAGLALVACAAASLYVLVTPSQPALTAAEITAAKARGLSRKQAGYVHTCQTAAWDRIKNERPRLFASMGNADAVKEFCTCFVIDLKAHDDFRLGALTDTLIKVRLLPRSANRTDEGRALLQKLKVLAIAAMLTGVEDDQIVALTRDVRSGPRHCGRGIRRNRRAGFSTY